MLILRHGEAEPMQIDDAARQLTGRGRAQVAGICERRTEALSAVKAIWASPFVRTRQTAEIVADKFGLSVKTEPLLIGDTRPQQVLDLLQRGSDFPLLLVSHQPLVGSLVNGLCGTGNRYPMGTASLASLSTEVWADGCAELDWLQHAV
nr:histidine phosphatase family protein [Microbulbifer sp. GX H0434]